jgi:hypothetical protein
LLPAVDVVAPAEAVPLGVLELLPHAASATAAAIATSAADARRAAIVVEVKVVVLSWAG